MISDGNRPSSGCSLVDEAKRRKVSQRFEFEKEEGEVEVK